MGDSNEPKVEQWVTEETLEEHLEQLCKLYDVKWRGHGRIYIDHEQYNIVAAHRILSDLSIRLGVPIQQLRSKLVELRWLNDVRSVLPVRDDVARVIESWAADEPEEETPEMNEEYDQD